MKAPSGRSRRAPGASPKQPSGLYVYALLGDPIRPRRLSGRTIDVIEVADIHVAVERRTMAPEISEEALRQQHDIVVRLAQISEAILPVRFGAFVTADELDRVIQVRQDTLRAALTEVRGREQMTVRILGKAETPPGQEHRGSGTEYLLGRAASHRVLQSPAAKAITEALRRIVVASHTDPGRGGIQLVMNHLIRRGDAGQYRALIDSVVAAVEPAPDLLVSGPWPPFAFVPDLWRPEHAISREGQK